MDDPPFGPLAHSDVLCHDECTWGKTTLQSNSRRPTPWKTGSLVFLILAMALAVASGDMLLVLAVATAVAGIFLLTTQRGAAAVRRPSALPIVEREATPDRPTPALRTRHASRRMAVRRYRVTTVLSRRPGDASQEPRQGVAREARVARAVR